jgi:hypothetical protein
MVWLVKAICPAIRQWQGLITTLRKKSLNLFPALREDLGNYGGAARPLIKGREALPLLAAMAA